jgi:ABC-type uncharacterized transport system permease subunit
VFWAVAAVALAGSASWAFVQVGPGWQTGLSAALAVSIAATLAVFLVLAAATREAWRLATLLLPYLVLLAMIAVAVQGVPSPPVLAAAPTGWLQFHIAVSVATYSLLTLAAVAALAVFLQERGLKTKRPNALTRMLPSVADAESLQVGLLVAVEIVLGFGVLSGMAMQYFETGQLLALDHKTLFSLLTFGVIGALLLAHYRTGIRGRRAARFVLLAYLLLTLAYPGVKFVTGVLAG